MRTTKPTDILLDNLSCFTPEEIERILNTEPKGRIGGFKKCEYGIMVERVVKIEIKTPRP